MWLMNRWFTRFLFDVENGIEKSPHAYIVRENDDRTQPTAYEDYPNPEAADVALFPGKGAPAYGTLMSQKPNGQGNETLIDNVEDRKSTRLNSSHVANSY